MSGLALFTSYVNYGSGPKRPTFPCALLQFLPYQKCGLIRWEELFLVDRNGNDKEGTGETKTMTQPRLVLVAGVFASAGRTCISYSVSPSGRPAGPGDHELRVRLFAGLLLVMLATGGASQPATNWLRRSSGYA